MNKPMSGRGTRGFAGGMDRSSLSNVDVPGYAQMNPDSTWFGRWAASASPSWRALRKGCRLDADRAIAEVRAGDERTLMAIHRSMAGDGFTEPTILW